MERVLQVNTVNVACVRGEEKVAGKTKPAFLKQT